MPETTIQEITPAEAWEILQSNEEATLFDVRTSMEFEYVGHPVNAINVPWKEAPDWSVNNDFVNQVQQALADKNGKSEGIELMPVLTICRSGKRSMAAAEELARHGFTQLYNVEQGFEGDRDGAKHRSTINGWRVANLPWEQS